MVDAGAVDERVARDRARHREREDQLSGIDVAAEPRTIITPVGDHQDARPPGRPTAGSRAPARRSRAPAPAPCHARPGRRSTAARDRTRRPAARCTPARRRPETTMYGIAARLDVPDDHGDRQEQHDGGDQRDAGRGLGVTGADDQQVPRRVQDGRREREPERRSSARYAGSSRSVAARLRSIAAGDQFRLAHPSRQPVGHLVVVLRARRVAGLPAAEHEQASRPGRPGWRRTGRPAHSSSSR